MPVDGRHAFEHTLAGVPSNFRHFTPGAFLQGLQGWFRGESRAAIERAFLTGFKRVLLPARLPGVELPEALTLREMTTVLTERVKEWTEQWKQAGLEQRRQEGLEQGTRRGELALLKRLQKLF